MKTYEVPLKYRIWGMYIPLGFVWCFAMFMIVMAVHIFNFHILEEVLGAAIVFVTIMIIMVPATTWGLMQPYKATYSDDGLTIYTHVNRVTIPWNDIKKATYEYHLYDKRMIQIKTGKRYLLRRTININPLFTDSEELFDAISGKIK